MRRLFSLLSLVFLIALGLFLVTLFLSAGPSSEEFIEVPAGMGSRQMADMLASRGIIRSRYSFDLWHLLRGGTLKAGEYRFDHKSSLREVYDRIRRGDVYYCTVVIPEGFNVFDIAHALQDAKVVSQDSFLAAAMKDKQSIADLDPQAPTLEGYLYPDTYRFQRFEPPARVIAAMVNRFRVAAALLGLDHEYHRVVTLASLIERETPVDTDRSIVASVFENRLAKGMPLMTDPTVIYAALLEKRYRGAIYKSDLAAHSTYNTYLHSGLPPGPICNPGLASLQAALHPAKTNFLYFVADPAAAGHSRFASTLTEHERNVAAYRRGLKDGQDSQ